MRRAERVVNDVEVPYPAFPNCTAAIVFSANDHYCPYLSVMLLSVLEHASASRFYDIIVLHRDITPPNQNKLRGMAEGMPNVSLRFLDVSCIIEGRSLYIGGRDYSFSVDVYSRLLIPDVLALEYEKALYLDSDMLALADVGELLDTKLDGCPLASCRDPNAGVYLDPDGDIRDYWDETLHLERPEDYFNSGVLVLDLDAFRAEWPTERLLQLAASGEWRFHDQDVLNMAYDGRARLIDGAWNAMRPFSFDEIPLACRAEFEEALRHPKIVHYAGRKPWENASCPLPMLFWETAARTPYYGEMVSRLLEACEEFVWLGDAQTPAPYRAAYFLIRKLYGGVRCLQEHGPVYTARRALEHLTGRA